MEPKIQTVSFFSEGYRIDGELYLPADLKPGEKLPACALVTGQFTEFHFLSLSTR
jgi:hypothetical protein